MSPEPPLRADARRNREKILAAACELFREHGTAVALDDIARRAGVGIGTLYRRFPDRDALIRQVVLDGFEICRAAVETARRELAAPAADPLQALERLFHRVLGERDRLVLPLIGGPLVRDPQVRELQHAVRDAVEDILAAGRAACALRDDVTSEDLIAAAAMACRPMPHLPGELGHALAARHLAVYLHGLRPEGARPLPAAPASHKAFGQRLAMDSAPASQPDAPEPTP
ncbi:MULTISPECIES: TetR/AcrR family transcriptional regulator [Streptomycetaceae]|uniref:TetR family transcriptional regulator n=1 Tax=Streptantibioticus cattleyicolor (strain ATCC 35852 / DSM 46488 / JCM 4925 / NBRC 14057 / NRRL 8057) TaxID=1003195 RepID=F8JS42_STREN|nr:MULTISPECIES: TetR/AcrR family transcriptional regulator [Streptomycetaceae]AEW94153.1 TetR family transcriptional regulator [Streptantibioticus cattleyicolor NRRL 8057 = DSM 46488]MYS58817.1 TetR family transcriptional regulator [Streptomyces sp. SID5468]CCB74506.1 putative TetR-family transcriptional regulator [Streptantibioticus cattleyicolor NRRL 8057 = DSM 46488]